MKQRVVRLGEGRARRLMRGHLLGDFELPPFLKYAVIPIARKVWLLIFVWIPAAAAHRLTIKYTSGWLMRRSVSCPVLPFAVRKRGVDFPSPLLATSRYALTYSSRL